MITRLVKMTFREECISEFITFFETRKQTISNFPGCAHLELWQDTAHKNICFTYSVWHSPADLDHYRFSEFFKDTWIKTKLLFADKAEAWSMDVIAQ
jgi:heme-degrading monooxygenase HmoA